jgi:tRNA threonylcarbamoyladenosine modification (KEOPS) complex  Pcc1 subunit
MDVSVKRSAAEFCTNVIARSVDLATTTECVDSEMRRRNVRIGMRQPRIDDFATDVIARSVDLATTAECVVGVLKQPPTFRS